MKKLLLALIFISTSLHAEIMMDSNRKEIREMTLKNHHPSTSYKSSRRELLQNIHLDKDQKGYYILDVYCDQKFRNSVGPNVMPDHTNINVEHTWPRSRFNKQESFSIQEADLHHLFPTQSRANSIRGNHNFYDFRAQGSPLDNCDISEIGTIPESRSVGFEPPDEQKGQVARALFYFSVRYNIEIPDYEEKVLREWNKKYPVDSEEVERNKKIQKYQGNTNPFIENPRLADTIKNF